MCAAVIYVDSPSESVRCCSLLCICGAEVMGNKEASVGFGVYGSSEMNGVWCSWGASSARTRY